MFGFGKVSFVIANCFELLRRQYRNISINNYIHSCAGALIVIIDGPVLIAIIHPAILGLQ